MRKSPRCIVCAEVIFLNIFTRHKHCDRTVTALALAVLLTVLAILPAKAAPDPANQALMLDCPSAILMEASTGEIMFEQNPDAVCPPASITKIMTLLLVMEAVDAGTIQLNDMVTASAHACSMGGSQIFLKEGESMTVEDMIKSVVIASANDAALALAEHLCGSEEAFVAKMNEKAKELGMVNTHFENTNGLDDTVEHHVTTARDVAIMSRALITHDLILKYSSIWMDTVRDGAFGLTNTNRLVRFYPGATGLKTGSTAKAKFCISATAKRGDMSLICVIMGAETRDIRNEQAKKLLDYGFANYELYTAPAVELPPVRVVGGTVNSCTLSLAPFSCVVKKGTASSVEVRYELPEQISAPLAQGQVVGRAIYQVGHNDYVLSEMDIMTKETVEKIAFGGLFVRMLQYFAGKY